LYSIFSIHFAFRNHLLPDCTTISKYTLYIHIRTYINVHLYIYMYVINYCSCNDCLFEKFDFFFYYTEHLYYQTAIASQRFVSDEMLHVVKSILNVWKYTLKCWTRLETFIINKVNRNGVAYEVPFLIKIKRSN